MEHSNKKYEKVKFVADDESPVLENKKCILLVSTGQKYHEGKKLAGTIDLINKSKFAVCVIAVADTLQRHNFVGKSPEDAYQEAKAMGDAWLERNANIINQLIPDTQILRWDEALQNSYYADLRKKIEKEYAENSQYKDAVDSTIAYFTERVKKRVAEDEIEKHIENCRTYLIEECPIIMPLWASQGYDYVIYPKPMTKAMAMTQEIFVKNIYPNKGQWLSLKFKKVNMKPNQETTLVNSKNREHADAQIIA